MGNQSLIMHAGKRMLRLLLILAVVAVAGKASESDRILTEAELAFIDRENAMWRLVRVEDEVPANVRLWRSKGFTEFEVNLLLPQLTAIWEVELERNYGWLSKEAIGRLQDVDRRFIYRLRTARLYQAAGIQSGQGRPETLAGVTREWQRAIQRELDSREIAEFRLMNSLSAQKVARWMKGLRVSPDELRTLCLWQRDFDGQHRDDPRFPTGLQRVRRIEDDLDYSSRLRALLGDDRFVVYLVRADPDFERLYQSVAQLENANATMALDLWWLKQRHAIHQGKIPGFKARGNQRAQFNEEAEAILGTVRFSVYRQDEAARWLRR